MVRFASVFALLLACMGMYALASLTITRRTKEIGIRKVLGASEAGIVSLLSKTFLWWVMMANVIAWPVVYFLMVKWLEKFAYRTQLGLWMIFLPGMLTFGIVILTVSFHTIKAATANPVDSIRYE